MIAMDCEQNGGDWDLLRLGIPTASCFKKIMTTKLALSKSRQAYLYKLAGERITGEKADNIKLSNFDRGHEREEESADLYQLMTGYDVKKIGFCFKNELRLFGASPDRLVNDDGGFETKDAAPHVQLERLETGWKGTEHKLQCMGSLLVTGRKWWDLQSYSRGIKPILIRFERDEAYLTKMESIIMAFLFDLKAMVAKHSA